MVEYTFDEIELWATERGVPPYVIIDELVAKALKEFPDPSLN